MSSKDDKNAPITVSAAIFAAAAASMIVQARGIDLAGPLGLPGALAVSFALFCYMAGYAIGARGMTRALGSMAGGLMLLTSVMIQYFLFHFSFLSPIASHPFFSFLPAFLNMMCLTLAAIAAGSTLPTLLSSGSTRQLSPMAALTVFNVGALTGLALSLPTVTGSMTISYGLALCLSVLHIICASRHARDTASPLPPSIVQPVTVIRPLSKQHRLAALAASLAFMLVELAVMRQAAASIGGNYASNTIMIALAIVALTIGSGVVAVGPKNKIVLVASVLMMLTIATLAPDKDRLWYLIQMTIAALIFPLLTRNPNTLSQRAFAGLYAASTLGSLLGPLVFVAIIKIGILTTWPTMAMVWVMVVLCTLLVLATTLNISGALRVTTCTLAAIAIANAVGQLGQKQNDTTVFLQDSYLATIAVHQSQEQNLRSLTSNGKTEAAIPIDLAQPHPHSDIPTQRLLALLPYTLVQKSQDNPAAPQALIIGLGSGTTAMTALELGILPDIVELDDAVVRASAYFYPDLARRLGDIGKRIHLRDAAAQLSLMPKDHSLDLIISQPSEPFINGSGPLYTKEFFGLAADRLKPQGVFAQWVQLYGLDEHALAGLLATMSDSFGQIMIFHPPHAGEIIVLGSNDDQNLVLTRANLLTRLGGSETALRMWANCGFFDRDTVDRSIFCGEDVLASVSNHKSGDRRINTKDMPYLQYLVPPNDPERLEEQIQTNLQVLNKSKLSKSAQAPFERQEKIPAPFLPHNLDVLKLRKSCRESLDKFLTTMHEKDLKLGNNIVEASLSIYPDDHETQLVAALIELCGGRFDRAAQSIKNAHRLCRQSAANYSCAVLHAWFRRDRQTAYANLKPTAPEPVRQLLAETSWASRVDISMASRAIRAVLQQASDESTRNSI